MENKRVLDGTVVSDKMEKTVVVLVIKKSFNKLYQKAVTKKKKYKVHDQENKAKVGDKVRILESKPYSKDKRFKLLEIIK